MMQDLFGNEVKITAKPAKKNGFNEYDKFVDKFKPKLTTDDCYTPGVVYTAVLDWVKRRFAVADTCRIIRPFYPGGDYLRDDYSGECVVVDNPPFSILANIIDNYNRMGVRFFLFAPHLTLFNSVKKCCVLPTDCDVTYDNGATVSTSFVTNLTDEFAVIGDPELGQAVNKANADNQRSIKGKPLPKYEYPDNVITSAIVGTMVSKGVTFCVRREDCEFIRALDAQKKCKKTIFGGGLLLSDKAAQDKARAQREAERLAAVEKEKTPPTVWEISPREKDIISCLGL